MPNGTDVVTNALGVIPDFRVDIVGAAVIWKSGDLPGTTIWSVDALNTGLATAQNSAAASATAAQTAQGNAAASQAAAEAAQAAATTIAATSVKSVNGALPDGSGNVTISTGGGTGGAVSSVNGQTGTVVISASSLGLGNVNNTSDAAKPISDLTQAALNLKADLAGTVRKVNGVAPDGSGNVVVSGGSGAVNTVNGVAPDGSGDVTLVKGNIGLGNVDNTSDANKPLSTATSTALAGKAADSAVVHNTGAETIAGVKTFSSPPVVPDGSFTTAKTAGLAAALAGLVAIASGSPVTAPKLWLGPTASLPGTKDSSTVYISY
jgi:hypothetical protein